MTSTERQDERELKLCTFKYCMLSRPSINNMPQHESAKTRNPDTFSRLYTANY
jgi:hypothetical protein